MMILIALTPEETPDQLLGRTLSCCYLLGLRISWFQRARHSSRFREEENQSCSLSCSIQSHKH